MEFLMGILFVLVFIAGIVIGFLVGMYGVQKMIERGDLMRPNKKPGRDE